MSTDPDLEKDAIRSEIHHHPPPPHHSDPSPLPPRLIKFQTLVGICSPSILIPTPHRPNARVAPNEGIYKRTCDEERKVRFRYTLSNYLVNGAGLAQIIVGAALTALGAANGPKGAVTVLGAANTIMAGTLTYLKGQGLPQRLDAYHHLLRTLREHIEEREREFLEPGCELDADEEILQIARMYQEVRQTAADNAPGNVLPPRGTITSLLKKPDIARSEVAAPRGDRKPGDMLMSGLQDLANYGRGQYEQQQHHHGEELGKEEREKVIGKAKEVAEEELRKAKAVADEGLRRGGEGIEHLGEGLERKGEGMGGGGDRT